MKLAFVLLLVLRCTVAAVVEFYPDCAGGMMRSSDGREFMRNASTTSCDGRGIRVSGDEPIRSLSPWPHEVATLEYVFRVESDGDISFSCDAAPCAWFAIIRGVFSGGAKVGSRTYASGNHSLSRWYANVFFLFTTAGGGSFYFRTQDDDGDLPLTIDAIATSELPPVVPSFSPDNAWTFRSFAAWDESLSVEAVNDRFALQQAGFLGSGHSIFLPVLTYRDCSQQDELHALQRNPAYVSCRPGSGLNLRYSTSATFYIQSRKPIWETALRHGELRGMYIFRIRSLDPSTLAIRVHCMGSEGCTDIRIDGAKLTIRVPGFREWIADFPLPPLNDVALFFFLSGNTAYFGARHDGFVLRRIQFEEDIRVPIYYDDAFYSPVAYAAPNMHITLDLAAVFRWDLTTAQVNETYDLLFAGEEFFPLAKRLPQVEFEAPPTFACETFPDAPMPATGLTFVRDASRTSCDTPRGIRVKGSRVRLPTPAIQSQQAISVLEFPGTSVEYVFRALKSRSGERKVGFHGLGPDRFGYFDLYENGRLRLVMWVGDSRYACDLPTGVRLLRGQWESLSQLSSRYSRNDTVWYVAFTAFPNQEERMPLFYVGVLSGPNPFLVQIDASSGLEDAPLLQGPRFLEPVVNYVDDGRAMVYATDVSFLSLAGWNETLGEEDIIDRFDKKGFTDVRVRFRDYRKGEQRIFKLDGPGTGVTFATTIGTYVFLTETFTWMNEKQERQSGACTDIPLQPGRRYPLPFSFCSFANPEVKYASGDEEFNVTYSEDDGSETSSEVAFRIVPAVELHNSVIFGYQGCMNFSAGAVADAVYEVTQLPPVGEIKNFSTTSGAGVFCPPEGYVNLRGNTSTNASLTIQLGVIVNGSYGNEATIEFFVRGILPRPSIPLVPRRIERGTQVYHLSHSDFRLADDEFDEHQVVLNVSTNMGVFEETSREWIVLRGSVSAVSAEWKSLSIRLDGGRAAGSVRIETYESATLLYDQMITFTSAGGNRAFLSSWLCLVLIAVILS